ncbi:hypothetical protein EMIHUDRAFT_361163, partial [Emiliania huxleyi CCMP1516]|uniref:Uncharacterized protein n=2 Tax=Emiliania huxleyi TaxID=2903 RepID=A0A0D3KWN3_EMIH1
RGRQRREQPARGRRWLSSRARRRLPIDCSDPCAATHTARCAAPPPCQVLLERAASASAGLSAAAEAAERARREAS